VVQRRRLLSRAPPIRGGGRASAAERHSPRRWPSWPRPGGQPGTDVDSPLSVPRLPIRRASRSCAEALRRRASRGRVRGHERRGEVARAAASVELGGPRASRQRRSRARWRRTRWSIGLLRPGRQRVAASPACILQVPTRPAALRPPGSRPGRSPDRPVWNRRPPAVDAASGWCGLGLAARTGTLVARTGTVARRRCRHGPGAKVGERPSRSERSPRGSPYGVRRTAPGWRAAASRARGLTRPRDGVALQPHLPPDGSWFRGRQRVGRPRPGLTARRGPSQP
jgi:hypothetical protein